MGLDLLPPKFTGDEIVKKWLCKFDAFISLKGYNDDQSLHTFTLLLTGEAERWFVSLPENVAVNWAYVRQAFIGRFQDGGPRWKVDQDLQKIKQSDDENIEEYASRVRDILCRYGRDINGEEILSIFLQGMRRSLFGPVVLKEPTSFREAVNFARLAEMVQDLDGQGKMGVEKSTSDPGASDRDILQQTCDSLTDALNLNTRLHEQLISKMTSQDKPNRDDQHFTSHAVRQNTFKSDPYSRELKTNRHGPTYGGQQIRSGEPVCRLCNKPGHTSPSCVMHSDRQLNSNTCNANLSINSPTLSSISTDKMHNSNLINVRIYGKNVNALVDTGSSVTVVTSKLLKEIPELRRVQIVKSSHDYITVASGGRLPVRGLINIPAIINNRSVLMPAHLVDNLNKPLIIGVDFMKMHRAIIDMAKNKLRLRSKLFMRSADKYLIPAKSECIISARLPSHVGDGILGTTPNIKSLCHLGLVTARVLAKTENDLVPIRIANASDNDVTLRRNTRLGVFKPLSEDDQLYNIDLAANQI